MILFRVVDENELRRLEIKLPILSLYNDLRGLQL